MNLIANSLGGIQILLDDLSRDVPAELADVTDEQSALILLALLRGARKQLQTIEGYCELAAAERMAASTFEAPGVRAVRRQTAERTEWDNPGLATAVLTSAIVDDNGELPDEAGNLLACKVKEALVECAAISYWRTGKLKEHGIDPSDFRKRTPGRYVVEVSLGDSVEGAA